MQKIQIKGRVTADPEVQESGSGKRYIKLGVACNRTDKDKEGRQEEVATYYNVYLFDKMAEVYKALKKGDLVFAMGDLKQDVYMSKEDDPRANNKVFAQEFHKVAWVGGKKSEEEKASEE